MALDHSYQIFPTHNLTIEMSAILHHA